MRILHLSPNKLTDSDIDMSTNLAMRGFEVGDFDEMRADVVAHYDQSTGVSVALKGNNLLGLSMSRTIGGRAIEWIGCIIEPTYQKQGLARRLILDNAHHMGAERIVACTRNPAILRMMGKASTILYPLEHNAELHELAMSMPYATDVNGAVYHIGRYPGDGLYGGDDPADLPVHKGGEPLNVQFPELQDARNSLVFAAQIPGHHHTGTS